jgi:hypothetical protein
LHQEGFKVIAGCGPTRDYTKWLDEQKALGFTFYASVGNVGDWDSTVEAFAKTKAERDKSGDPRLSLEERYPTPLNYLERLKEAALKLQAEGFLLDEDVTRIIERASAR